MQLTELPNELLCHIIHYLTAEDIWKNLRASCKRFNSILQSDTYWTSRANIEYGARLPPRLRLFDSPNINLFHGVKHFAAVEFAHKKWSTFNISGEPHSNHVHYGTVDVVKIFNSKNLHRRFCYTGARDRAIILWDMDKIKDECDKNKWIVEKLENAHQGWIWSMDISENERFLYSTSWDGSIKQWQLAEAKIVESQKFNFQTAVLSSICDGENLLYTSTFNSGPILCDTRSGVAPIKILNVHGSSSVFDMTSQSNSNYLYSVAEDCRLIALDKRMFEAPIHTLKFNKRLSRIDNSDNYLCLSFRDGHLLFLHPQTLSTETELTMNDPTGNNGATDQIAHSLVKCSMGSTICGYNQKIKVFTSGLTPTLLADLEMENMISKLDYVKNQLVVGFGTGEVRFWT